MSGGRRRSLLAVLAVAAALCILALWAIPRALDWDRHRDQLAAVASERLGRPVALEGPISVSLLPEPWLVADRVRVGAAADEIGVQARGLRLRLDLWRFLLGRVEVREVALVGADIRLPWPPTALPGLLLPPWLADLDIRIEDSRLAVGEAAVEGVTARFAAGGPLEALTGTGEFRWRGQPVRFEARLGRTAGDDGFAPLDLSVSTSDGATLQARGVLLAQGGFEGRLDAAGPDLASILPAPPGPFRARGTLRAGADAVATDALALEFGPNGERMAARGAATLRLVPAPRLDLSLSAARLDIGPWLGALRGAAPQVLPLALDLSAEQATLGGLPLRRLRAGALLEGGRVTLTDVTADLPGGTQAELSGTTVGPRLDAALVLRSAWPRELAKELGLPDAVPLPEGAAAGTMRLAWEGANLSATDIALRFGGTRVAGGVAWRAGPRPSLALGLDLDALEVSGRAAALDALRDASAAADLTLRLNIGRLSADGVTLNRVALDGATEGPRFTLRAANARLGPMDLSASGVLQWQPQLRLSNAIIEAQGPLGALGQFLELPEGPLPALPVRLRLSANGAWEALAIRAEADAADARIEAQGQLDAGARRLQGNATLRHPGATRLLEQLGFPAAWIGPGSLSVIAAGSVQPDQAAWENLEIVAGTLRLRGQGALSWQGDRPRLTGRAAAERLPLPGIPLQSSQGLRGAPPFDAEIALTAEAVDVPGLPAIEQAAATLRAAEGEWRVEGLRARMAGGEVEGQAALALRGLPRLALEGRLSGAVVTGPVTEGALDLTAGRTDAAWRLLAEGWSPAAMLAALEGEAALAIRSGVLTGVDLPAIAAAGAERDPWRADGALRGSMAGGATPLDRATLRAAFARGIAVLEEGEAVAEGGAAARLTGSLDLWRQRLDLRIAVPMPEGPEVALRLFGPPEAPLRQPEIGARLRHLAETSR